MKTLGEQLYLNREQKPIFFKGDDHCAAINGMTPYSVLDAQLYKVMRTNDRTLRFRGKCVSTTRCEKERITISIFVTTGKNIIAAKFTNGYDTAKIVTTIDELTDFLGYDEHCKVLYDSMQIEYFEYVA